MLATHEHAEAIATQLNENGIASHRAVNEGRLLILDADDVLAGITLDGRVDVDAFRCALTRFIDPGVKQRLYGELVSLLAQRGDLNAALAIESVGHELAHAFKIPAMCGYCLTGARTLTGGDVASITAVHDRSVFEATSVFADGARASTAPSEATRLHAVRFYENRESLAKIVANFLGEGFITGLPGIVIATPEHIEAISQVLAAHYFDLERLHAAGDLIMVDASDALSLFMRDGMPDSARFRDAMIPLIEQACRGRANYVIRAYGEMVDVLWKAGQTAAAIRLEMLWNQLAQTHSFALLCGYSMGQFYKDVGQREIRDQHTHIVTDSGKHITLH